jgi:NADH:ubiquinone oxidoreductase subunit D
MQFCGQFRRLGGWFFSGGAGRRLPLPSSDGAYVETECPRGQMGFCVVGAPTKAQVPLRVRARSSNFSNLSVTNEICRGCLIADVATIVGSIDIVMGVIDR